MIIFNRIFLFFAVLIPLHGLTINHADIDSLKAVVSLQKKDSTSVNALNQLAIELQTSDQLLALQYAVSAEKLSEEVGYKLGLALANKTLGDINADKRNNELALEYYHKCLDLQEVLNKPDCIADAYAQLGLIYVRMRRFDEALKNYSKGLDVEKLLNDSVAIACSYRNIGIVYTKQGKYDKALINFYKSLRIKESLNDSYGIADSYGNIGIIYLKINSLDQAKVSLERALSLFNEINNQDGVAISSLNLGEIFFQQEKYTKAMNAYRQSLEIYSKSENIKGIADAYYRLGKAYYALGNDFLARDDYKKSLDYFTQIDNKEGILTTRISLARLFQKYQNHEEAIRQLRIAIQFANEGGYLAEEHEALNILADLLLVKKAYKEVAELLVRSRDISDSLFNEKRIQEVTQITMQYNFDNQLKEAAFKERSEKLLHELELKKLRYARNILIISIILVLLIGSIVYSNSRVVRGKNRLLEKQKERIAKQVEMLDKQKKELILANKTKDKFLSIIGHDLRNPFNAINTFVSIVNEQMQEFDHRVFNKYLQLIKEAGSNANNLLDNLMEWAMIQSGELKPRFEPVYINSIAKGNALLITESAFQKDVKINVEFDVDVLVSVDKNMINTVLRNLLSNALKFTPAQGTITLKTQLGDNEVKVIVEDTGIGLKQTQIDTIMPEDYSNIEGANSLGQGSGLGVVLCQEFLAVHGQKLNISSAVDKGSVFWFYLPIVK